MYDEATSTIAQLLFVKRPELNFAHVVGELDAALARCPAQNRTLSWDCDDVAIFDLDGSRIALGYCDDLGGEHAACLTVSVGHGPAAHLATTIALRRNSLCRMITDRLTDRYGIDDIRWHDAAETVTPDMIDALLDTLPRAIPEPEIAGSIAEAECMTEVTEAGAAGEEVDRLMARLDEEMDARPPHPRHITPRPAREQAQPAPAAAATIAANDSPDIPKPKDAELARVRAALYPPEIEAAAEAEPANSVPIRLACHAMNATLIVVALPIGVAVMTYSLVRGEDLKLSTRMMVLTGSLLSFSHTSLGQQVMAMI